MRTFEFRMETLLKIRRSRRDLCQQFLAQAQEEGQRIDHEILQLDESRRHEINGLREAVQKGRIDIDRAAARRYYAGRLQIDLLLAERRRELVANQIDLCRQALVRADQDVKSLEKLREKQAEDFRLEQDRRTQQTLEDNWRSVQLTGTA